jgi:hypothetical protein
MYYYTKCNMAVSYKTQEPCTLGECLGSPPGFDLVRIDHMTCVVFFSFFFLAFLCVFCLSSSTQCWMCHDFPSSFDCLDCPSSFDCLDCPSSFDCLDYPSSFDCVLTAPPVFSNVYIPYLEKKNRRSIQQQISICNQKKKSCNLLMKKPIPKQTDTMLLLVFWW